jgi:hypothetical protein
MSEFLHGAPVSFDDWYKSLDPRELPAPERELLQKGAKRLLADGTLKYILSVMEAKQLYVLTNCDIKEAETSEKARLLVRAIRALRLELKAFVGDRKLEQSRSSRKQ